MSRIIKIKFEKHEKNFGIKSNMAAPFGIASDTAINRYGPPYIHSASEGMGLGSVRAQMPNLRTVDLMKPTKLFIPSTECVLMLARRIFIGLSVPTAAAVPPQSCCCQGTHTRIDNLAISAKPYYTKISRHGETTDCVNGKCHLLHSHFKIRTTQQHRRSRRLLKMSRGKERERIRCRQLKRFWAQKLFHFNDAHPFTDVCFVVVVCCACAETIFGETHLFHT